MLSNKTSLDFLGVASETMHLCVFLAFVLWGSESYCVPMKVTTMALQKSHTAICAEIQQELSEDKKTYHVKSDFPSILTHSRL